MERPAGWTHNGAMTGLNWRRRAAIAVCAAAMFLLGLPTGATAQERTEPAGDIEVVSVRFEAVDRIERWLGGTVRGDAFVTIANNSDRLVTVDDAGVMADGRTYLLPTLDLEPGRIITVSTRIDVGGLSFAERDIVAVAGSSQAAIVHREIPWILVGLVGWAPRRLRELLTALSGGAP